MSDEAREKLIEVMAQAMFSGWDELDPTEQEFDRVVARRALVAALGAVEVVAREKKLIEVVGRALYESIPPERPWDDLGPDSLRYWRRQGRVALDAALGAVDEETCPEPRCDEGWLDNRIQATDVCPSCSGSGKVNPRWLIPRYEQVGWLNADGDMVERCHRTGCRNCATLVPLFREVFPVPQEADRG